MGPCRPSKPLGRVLNSALLLFKRNASFPKSLFGLVSERPRCSGSLLFSSVTVKTTQIEHKQIPDSWLLAHSHQGPEPGLLLHLRVGPCSCVPDSIQGRKLLEEDVSLLFVIFRPPSVTCERRLNIHENKSLEFRINISKQDIATLSIPRF